MVMFISWREFENLTFVMLFLVISTLVQLIIVEIIYYNYPISSYFILILVPLGVIPCLAAGMLIFSDFLYQYRHFQRQNKMIQNKEENEKPVSIFITVMIASGIVIAIYILIYSLFAFLFHDPISLHGIPTFGQFTLSETLSAIIIIIIPTILKEFQIAKKMA